MSHSAYNTMAMVVGAAVLFALGVALYSFVLMLVRWKTPSRKRHAIRFIVAMFAVPCLAGIQYSVFCALFCLIACSRSPTYGRIQCCEGRKAR